MSRAIFSLLALAVLLSSCTFMTARPESPLPTQSLPQFDKVWSLKMSHTGGIMGLSRSIEISSDGTFTVVDEREKKTVEGQLSDAELSKLIDLLTSISNEAPEGHQGSCADCFVYEIELNTGDHISTVQVDDTTIEESGLEPLVAFLRGIIDKSLQ